MTSNGILVKNQLENIKKLDSLTISIDGDEKATDTNRGKGTYRKALEAIKIAKENGVIVRTNTVLSKANFSSYKHILELAKKHDFLCTFGVPAEEEIKNIILTKEKIIKLHKELKELKRAGDPILLSEHSLDYMIDYPKQLHEIVYKNEKNNFSKSYQEECLFGRAFCYIDSNGMVYPCMNLGFKSKGFKSLSLLDVGFKKAWNNLKNLNCVTCYGAECSEWNYLCSMKGIFYGVQLSLKQMLRRR